MKPILSLNIWKWIYVALGLLLVLAYVSSEYIFTQWDVPFYARLCLFFAGMGCFLKAKIVYNEQQGLPKYHVRPLTKREKIIRIILMILVVLGTLAFIYFNDKI